MKVLVEQLNGTSKLESISSYNYIENRDYTLENLDNLGAIVDGDVALHGVISHGADGVYRCKEGTFAKLWQHMVDIEVESNYIAACCETMGENYIMDIVHGIYSQDHAIEDYPKLVSKRLSDLIENNRHVA